MNWTTIEPMVAEFVTLVIIALITYATKILKSWIDENKRGKQLIEAAQVAKGIWIFLEEYVPKIVGQSKMDEMKRMLHVDFPLLSDAQLTSINKTAHMEMKNLYAYYTQLPEPASTPVEEAEFVVEPTPTED